MEKFNQFKGEQKLRELRRSERPLRGRRDEALMAEWWKGLTHALNQFRQKKEAQEGII